VYRREGTEGNCWRWGVSLAALGLGFGEGRVGSGEGEIGRRIWLVKAETIAG